VTGTIISVVGGATENCSIPVYTLIGVFVGALITKGFDYFLARRSEKVQKKRDSEERAIAVKTAARLVDEELSWRRAAAAQCIKQRSWWVSSTELTRAAWKENKRILATELSSADWRAVSVGVMAMGDLVHVKPESGGPIAESTIEKIEPILRDIEAARMALDRFAHGELPSK
jgi:hypothetical protein